MSTPDELKETPFLRSDFGTDALSGRISGYAAVFGNVDAHGDVIAAGAFKDTLAEAKARGDAPMLLWRHDQEKLIGRWTELREDGIGLHVVGTLNLGTQGGREAFEHVKAGDLNGLSIGYQVRPGGAERQGGYRLLKALNLVEISIVTMPSNPKARIQLDSKGALEAVLTKSGLSKEAARRVAFGGWPALIGQEPSTPDYSKAADLADQMARATAQLKAMR